MTSVADHAAQLLAEAKAHRSLADRYEHAAETLRSPVQTPLKRARPNVTVPKKRGRGRPKGSGPRFEQTVNIVRQQQGPVTVSEIAAVMGIRPNYLYRVVPGLVESGALKEESNGTGPVRYSAV